MGLRGNPVKVTKIPERLEGNDRQQAATTGERGKRHTLSLESESMREPDSTAFLSSFVVVGTSASPETPDSESSCISFQLDKMIAKVVNQVIAYNR